MKSFRFALYGFLLLLFSLRCFADEFRALWVDSWAQGIHDAAQISKLVNDARAGHFNTLVVEVRRRADAFYESRFEPKCADVAANFDPLADLLAKAHDTNSGPHIGVHCWLVTYPACTGKNYPPPQPNHPLNLHPDWQNLTYLDSAADDSTESEDGGKTYYFDPAHPEVQKHIFNVAMDLVSRYDIDGLNWDYIRYPGPEWGYNPVSITRFNSRFHRTGQPSQSDPVWTQFRRDQVTALVRKVYLSAIALKPKLILSADTFSFPTAAKDDSTWPESSAYKGVLQDWRAWMEEGILDLNMPMTYYAQTTHAQDYLNSSAFTKNHRYNRFAVIGPSMYQNNISNNMVQIRSTRTATATGNHADGVACYSYAGSSKDHQPIELLLKALTQPSEYDSILPPVFETEDIPPPMPWKISPTKGHLKGFVVDHRTTGIDGARVMLNGPLSKNFITDATGFYGAVDLPTGKYEIAISADGFAPASRAFSIEAGNVTDETFSLTSAGLAIVLQPQDQTVLVSSDASFSLSTTGVQPIEFQWLFNDAPIAGAKTSELMLPNAKPANDGDYKVIVSNSSGSVTSLVAKLTVRHAINTSVDGDGTILLSPKQSGYPRGSKIIATAQPAAGFMFSHWSGAISGSNNHAKIFVASNLSITAHFERSRDDLILDNDKATFNGDWSSGSSSPDRYGADYQISPAHAGEPTATATYRPSIRNAGNYDVFIWYPQGSNRATNAPWTISSAGNSVTKSINETSDGGNWFRIGTKYFEAGTNGFVQLQNNAGPDKSAVIADAVRFVRSDVRPFDTNALSKLREGKQTHMLADFETNQPGHAVLFGFGGTSAEFVDRNNPSFILVTNKFPSGNSSAKVLAAKWNFIRGESSASPWLRLTTHQAPVLPNPTVDFQQKIGLAVYAERDVYLAVGLRETSSDANCGADGGTNGTIEWVGAATDSKSITGAPKGRLIPAGRWCWVEFCIPSEPVRRFTGNNVLESFTGKGVFEELAVTPADGLGAYALYLDDFCFIDLE